MKNFLRTLSVLFFLLITKSSLSNCEIANNDDRIVAAGGSVTETIFFLEKEKNLVARDLTSNFPQKALELPSIGYVRNLSTEGLLSLKPTLILAEADVGPDNVIEQVKKTSIELRIVPDDYSEEGILSKALCIGSILDVDDELLNNKINSLKKSINALNNVKEKAKSRKKIILILMMRGTSPIVAGSKTSGDGFITMTGNENAFLDMSGWKPVGLENIIERNPNYIIVTKRGFSGFKSTDDFLKQTGLIATQAGKNGKLIVGDGMEMLGFGPRTLTFAAKISELLTHE